MPLRDFSYLDNPDNFQAKTFQLPQAQTPTASAQVLAAAQPSVDDSYKPLTGVRRWIDLTLRHGGLTPGRDNAQINAVAQEIASGRYNDQQLAAIKNNNPYSSNIFGAAQTQFQKNRQISQELKQFAKPDGSFDMQGAGQRMMDMGQTDLGIKFMTEAMAAKQKSTTESRQMLTPFQKELDAFNKMKPNDPGYNQLKAHLSRMDAPTQAMLVNQPAINSTQSKLTGEEFLKTLPPGDANLVKALDEGRAPISSLGIRGPQRERMMKFVTQYDPSFDAATYPQRQAVRRDFTSGQSARNVTAINTAIGHMGTMSDLGNALQNKDARAVNALFNRIATETGNPKVTNFNIAKGAVGNELMRVFRQVGASEVETKDWESRWNEINSPQQIQEALRVGADLLDSRIESLNDQWRRGMNTDQGYPNLLSPKSQQVLKILGPKSKSDAASPQTTPAGSGKVKFLGFE